MKKTLIVVAAVAILVVAFGAVGSAYAMGDAGKGPGNGGNGAGAAGANESGILSAYMTDAIASVLELDPAVVAERLAAGETCYDIALSMGYTDETWPALFESVKDAALEAAAADGLSPQLQTRLNNQLNTNLGVQQRLHDGSCDGTGECQAGPAGSFYAGANAGMRGYRGGR